MNQSVEWNVCEKNLLVVWVVFLGEKHLRWPMESCGYNEVGWFKE